MNILFTRPAVVAIIALVPFVAAAQGAFDDFIDTVSEGLNTIIVFLFLIATVIFLWGVVRYIAAGGDEEEVKAARSMIIWGIIFLAVMVAVWGFVNIVLDFVFGTEDPFPIPGQGRVPSQE
jgi:uncharacterized membrane protein (GlpM family)